MGGVQAERGKSGHDEASGEFFPPRQKVFVVGNPRRRVEPGVGDRGCLT